MLMEQMMKLHTNDDDAGDNEVRLVVIANCSKINFPFVVCKVLLLWLHTFSA